MTNQEQAYYWLGQAEIWRQRLGDAEARFDAACRAGKTKMSEEAIQVRIATAAKDNFGYQRAASKLEAAEKRATMYALFALMEKDA
jgi:TolA-binding protein